MGPSAAREGCRPSPGLGSGQTGSAHTGAPEVPGGLLVPDRLQAGTRASGRRTSGGTARTLRSWNGPCPEPSASSAESGWEARPGAWRLWAERPVSSWPCGRWGLVRNLRPGGLSVLSGLCPKVPGAGWQAQQGKGLRLQPPRGSGTCLIRFVGADPPGGQAWPGRGEPEVGRALEGGGLPRSRWFWIASPSQGTRGPY